MSWSFDQERALSLTHHIALVANAGSGKTSVLTERFARIIRNGVADLDNVVAITFTKKAAAEMRHRVHDALANSSSEAARRSLARIAQARISTFHSFCGTLLRQYPHESGVAVDARELSTRESSVLRGAALRDGMNDALSARSTIRTDLLTAFDELGVATVEQAIRTMMISRELLEHRSAWWHSATVDDLLRQREQASLDFIYSNARTVCRTLLDNLALVVDSSHSVVQQAHDILTELEQPQPAVDVLPRLLDLYGTLYTNEGTPRKRNQIEELRDLHPIGVQKKTLQSLWALPVADVERLGLRIVGAMIEAAQHCAERYAALRTSSNVIDFDDMMVGVRNMLHRHPDVAAEVRQSISFLMVDEFQDTNPVQYDVVRLLAPELKPDGADDLQGQHPNVFIVGDPKQSIYGFRAADVRLFRQAQADIRRANLRRNAASDGLITLSASYRMHENLAGVVDRWCGHVFVQNSEYDVDYTPLVAGRITPAAFDGSVHVLCTDVSRNQDDDVEDNDDSKLVMECRHVAMRLCEWLQPTGGLTVCSRDQTLRPASAGDVAILARSLQGVEAMATALRDVGIPFQLHGGRAFFSRPEVDDIRSLLRFCTDTADDVALAATLRSPLIRCSHESLVLAGAMRPFGATLWDGLIEACKLVDAPADVAIAVGMLREAIADVQTMPLTVAVRRMLERGPWYEFVGASARRDQIVANVEKVLSLLRDELRQGATHRDAVEALTPPDDGGDADATFETDPHSVQIMTIHAAKGLQFPVVVVIGLDARDPKTEAVQWSDTLGLTVALPTAIVPAHDPTTVQHRPASVAHDVNIRIAKQAAEAEDRRVIYVALTRAQDHLALSQSFSIISSGAMNKPGSLARYLRPVLFSEPPQASELQHVDVIVRRDNNDAVTEQPLRLPIQVHVANPATDVRSAVYDVDTGTPTIVDLSASLMHLAMPDMVSVTELLDAGALADEPSARTVGDDIAEASGAAYGTLVHYLLQHALVAQANPHLPETAAMLEALVMSRTLTPAVRRTAVAETLGVLRSSQFAYLQQAWFDANYETARTAAFGDTVLYGVMDVLATRKDGAVQVVDWKTNRRPESGSLDEVAAIYAPQQEAYAWLALHAYPDARSVVTTLVFTHPVVSGQGALLYDREYHRSDMDTLRTSINQHVTAMLERRLRRLRV